MVNTFASHAQLTFAALYAKCCKVKHSVMNRDKLF